MLGSDAVINKYKKNMIEVSNFVPAFYLPTPLQQLQTQILYN